MACDNLLTTTLLYVVNRLIVNTCYLQAYCKLFLLLIVEFECCIALVHVRQRDPRSVNV